MVASLVLACGGESTSSSAKGLCGDESRADTYVANLDKATAANMAMVRLVEATPGPPDRGDNTWMFEVSDASGTPMEPDAITVKPWMPDHGHGTTPSRFTPAAAGQPGRYQLGPMNFFMPGFWIVTLTIERAGQADEVTFSFCVEG